MSTRMTAVALSALVLVQLGTAMGEPSQCSLRSCDVTEDAGLARFLGLNAEADKECFEVLLNSVSHGREKQIRERYPEVLGRDTSCDQPFVLLRGAMDSSIYTSKGGKGLLGQEHAFSILPTFAVAIPVRLEARSPASDALAGGGTVSGVAFRYSPMSYWVGVSIGFGVMAPSTANLDRELFKSPKLLTLGGGVTVLGNLLSVGIFRAWLYTEGYMSTLGSSATYLNIELDLSALGLAALGAAK